MMSVRATFDRRMRIVVIRADIWEFLPFDRSLRDALVACLDLNGLFV